MNTMELDPKDFRRALGQFPTGVTVISTLDSEGNPVGVTANSFSSVSLNPPLILWSIDKNSRNLNTFLQTEHFAVNVLTREQVETSHRFSRRGDDKYRGVDFILGIVNSPLLEDCAAQFECKTWKVHEAGDHYIIIGEVIDYRYDDCANPLIFLNGSYGVSMEHPSTLEEKSRSFRNKGYLSDFSLHLLQRAFSNYSSQLVTQLRNQFDLSPKLWEVLALLTTQENVTFDELSQLTMQQYETFTLTIETLLNSGLVTKDAGQLSLTEAGEELMRKFFYVCRKHEQSILKELTEEQVDILKLGLKSIINA